MRFGLTPTPFYNYVQQHGSRGKKILHLVWHLRILWKLLKWCENRVKILRKMRIFLQDANIFHNLRIFQKNLHGLTENSCSNSMGCKYRISHGWHCIVYSDMTYQTEESSRHLSTMDQWHPKCIAAFLSQSNIL